MTFISEYFKPLQHGRPSGQKGSGCNYFSFGVLPHFDSLEAGHMLSTYLYDIQDISSSEAPIYLHYVIHTASDNGSVLHVNLLFMSMDIKLCTIGVIAPYDHYTPHTNPLVSSTGH